jgi:hypothetical protein
MANLAMSTTATAMPLAWVWVMIFPTAESIAGSTWYRLGNNP